MMRDMGADDGPGVLEAMHEPWAVVVVVAAGRLDILQPRMEHEETRSSLRIKKDEAREEQMPLLHELTTAMEAVALSENPGKQSFHTGTVGGELLYAASRPESTWTRTTAFGTTAPFNWTTRGSGISGFGPPRLGGPICPWTKKKSSAICRQIVFLRLICQNSPGTLCTVWGLRSMHRLFYKKKKKNEASRSPAAVAPRLSLISDAASRLQ